MGPVKVDPGSSYRNAVHSSAHHGPRPTWPRSIATATVLGTWTTTGNLHGDPLARCNNWQERRPAKQNLCWPIKLSSGETYRLRRTCGRGRVTHESWGTTYLPLHVHSQHLGLAIFHESDVTISRVTTLLEIPVLDKPNGRGCLAENSVIINEPNVESHI